MIALNALEINAVHHCNLTCIGCSHASPVSARGFADPDAVHRDLAGLASALRVDHVKVVGGEPLLHPDLAGLLKAIRGSGIGGRVRVATNGTVFARAGWDWLQHADDIHVSRYPGTQVREAEMAELVDRCRATDTELVVKTYERFRLVLPESPLKPDEAKEVFSTCQLAHGWSCHTVEDGYFYLCPRPARNWRTAARRTIGAPSRPQRDSRYGCAPCSIGWPRSRRAPTAWAALARLSLTSRQLGASGSPCHWGGSISRNFAASRKTSAVTTAATKTTPSCLAFATRSRRRRERAHL